MQAWRSADGNDSFADLVKETKAICEQEARGSLRGLHRFQDEVGERRGPRDVGYQGHPPVSASEGGTLASGGRLA